MIVNSRYPLPSVAGFSQHTYSGVPTWDSPAIASNGTNGTFIAAVALRTDYTSSSCGGVKFYKSTNAFLSATTYSYSDMCTFDAPAIAYNEDEGLWIIVWVDHSEAVEENTNRLLYRTSSNGSTWGTIRSVGRYSMETPGLACSYFGDCLLTYVRASDFTPNVVARKVTFSSSGIISLGSFKEYDNFLQREVAAANYVGSKWMTAWGWTNNADWRSRGWGTFESVASSSVPPSGSSALVGESAEHPPALAGFGDYSALYLFNVD